MTGEKTVNLDIDPIFKICLIIFAVAAIIAIGAWINNDYIATGDEMASNGDEVTVNYIGTYYGYLGEDNAVLFDTSYSNIANDGNIAKSNDFTKKSSYSPLSYTIGGTTVLKAFGDAVIGHKVGEKVKVMLSASEGYVGANTYGTLMTSGNIMDAEITMSKEMFASAYPKVNLVNGQMVKFDTKYTWTGYALLSGNNVIVTNMPTTGTYEVYKSGDTVVNYEVKTVSSGKITYDIEIKNPVKVGSTEIQMIKLDLGTKTIYITNIDGSDIIYKEGAERVNQPLFFEIKVLTIE